MTLRARIAVVAATAVAVAVVAASAGLYVATARALRGGVDRSLAELAADLADRTPRPGVLLFGPRAGRLGGPGGFVQVVTPAGRVLGVGGADVRPLPVEPPVIDVAAGRRDRFFRTATVDGHRVRVLTVPGPRGMAVQVARPLDEVEDVLASLRRQLLAGSVGGVVLAAALGGFVARRATRPLDDLTVVAEEVAATHDLSRRIDVGPDRGDEVARLARTFNAMLANLEQARRAQRQLVADASHELRTPLTSLRTNIEVLADAELLDPAERRVLIEDVVVQIDEFGRLVAALVELARGAEPARRDEAVRLDEVVARAVGRVGAWTATEQPIQLRSEATTVSGDRDALERAVVNLLDNAVKYGGHTPIDVVVADGAVTVRDHGPGIAQEDLERVFDRFYRAPQARGAPGSGLGLAIVRQVAVSHGGAVRAANAPGGGASFTLRLPAVRTADGVGADAG